VLLAECNGVGGADALVHQLGDIGRLQGPFLGDRLHPTPDCIDGMRAIALKTVGGLSPRGIARAVFASWLISLSLMTAPAKYY
jgi:hypothetical protein